MTPKTLERCLKIISIVSIVALLLGFVLWNTGLIAAGMSVLMLQVVFFNLRESYILNMLTLVLLLLGFLGLIFMFAPMHMLYHTSEGYANLTNSNAYQIMQDYCEL